MYSTQADQSKTKFLIPNQMQQQQFIALQITSTCFGQFFVHLQERKTEIFTAYGIPLLW